jgi:hypothetical protein
MEWFNVHRCEEFGHETGVYVTLEQAEKLGREGAELVRKHSFTTVAKMTVAETPAADKMYEELAKVAKNSELAAQLSGPGGSPIGTTAGEGRRGEAARRLTGRMRVRVQRRHDGNRREGRSGRASGRALHYRPRTRVIGLAPKPSV